VREGKLRTGTPKLFFDNEPVREFDDLIGKFPKKAFASPYRSSVPLIALVKDDWPLFQKVLSGCGLPADVSVHFEYQVKSPRRNGTPSHSDLMLLSESSAGAVEAKWTEPRYPDIAKRLTRKARSDDEANVQDPRDFIEGWLELLGQYCAKPLRLDDFSSAVYQTVHRAASACALSRSPTLVYIHFLAPGVHRSRKYPDHYYEDLKYLHGLMGNPVGFPFYLVEITVEPSPRFLAIQNLTKGLEQTDREVRSAFSDRLFNFGDPRIRGISGLAKSSAPLRA
jgi:hypothetical protein